MTKWISSVLHCLLVALLQSAAYGQNYSVGSSSVYLPEQMVAILAKATPRQHKLFTEQYRRATNPTDKRVAGWVIAWAGDEQTLDLFKNTLFSNYGGRELSIEEEDSIFDNVRAIGILASHNKSAFSLLQQATHPAFWSKRKTWTSKRGKFSIDLLVIYSLHAIGLSGRAEALVFLKQLKFEDPNYLHRFALSVVTATFFYDMVKSRGEKFLKNDFFRPEERTDLFEEWRQKELGKNLYDWADMCSKGPLPSEPKSHK